METIRIGNPVDVIWTFKHTDGTLFPIANYTVELYYYTSRGKTKVTDTSALEISGNELDWHFTAAAQPCTGIYNLQLKVFVGSHLIGSFDRKEVFALTNTGLVSDTPIEIELSSKCDYISVSDAIINAQHATDEAAAVAQTQVVVGETETSAPGADANVEGTWDPTTHKLTLGFTIPRGAQGPQGTQGNTGSSVDYPFELVNNLTTDDATKALSAAQGKVLKDLMNEGYQFRGVATPTTNPGTPDQKVFYIASKVGTYSNFGGIVVNDGEMTIFKYDTIWNKEIIQNETLSTMLYGGDLKLTVAPVDSAVDERFTITSDLLSSTRHITVAFYPIKVGRSYHISIPVKGYASYVYAVAQRVSNGGTVTEVGLAENSLAGLDTTTTEVPIEVDFVPTDSTRPYLAVAYKHTEGVPTITETTTINGLFEDENAGIVTAKYESILGENGLRIRQSTFTDGQKMEATNYPYCGKFGNRYAFYGKVNNFDTLIIGIGYQSYLGLSFYIDNNNVTIKYDEDERVKETWTHGLSISTFIQISITHLDDGKYYVVINTLNGVSTHKTTISHYNGTTGMLKAINDGCNFTDVTFVATNKNFRMPLWIFGASYEGINVGRWPGQLKSMGFFEYYINGFAGRNSKQCWEELQRALNFGCPKYLYWAMWGNGTAAELDNYIGMVKGLCDQKKITLIIIDRPNSPAVADSYADRKAVIEKYKALGVRYVDSAIALSSDPSNANGWYEGFLSDDGKHPTELGARALAMRVLVDIPEIMQYGYTYNNESPIN